MQLPVLGCGFKLLQQTEAPISLSPISLYLSLSLSIFFAFICLLATLSDAVAVDVPRHSCASLIASTRVASHFCQLLRQVALRHILLWPSTLCPLSPPPFHSPLSLCVAQVVNKSHAKSDKLPQADADRLSRKLLPTFRRDQEMPSHASVSLFYCCVIVAAAAASLATLSRQIKSTQIAFPTLMRSFFYFMAATQCHKAFYSHNWQTQLQLHLSPGYQIYRGQTFSTPLQTDTPDNQAARQHKSLDSQGQDVRVNCPLMDSIPSAMAKVLATFNQFPCPMKMVIPTSDGNNKLSPHPPTSRPLPAAAGHNPWHNSCHKSAMKCVVSLDKVGNTRIIASKLCLRAALCLLLLLLLLLLLSLGFGFGIDWALVLACCGGWGERERERGRLKRQRYVCWEFI